MMPAPTPQPLVFVPLKHGLWRGLVREDWLDALAGQDPIAWLESHPRTLASDSQAMSRQVYRLEAKSQVLYAKVFHGLNEAHAAGQGRWLDKAKWRWRPSRAMQTLGVSRQMFAAGLHCPLPVLAMREYRAKPRDLFISQAVDGQNVGELLWESRDTDAPARLLRAIAPQVARLHQARFLHGDLLPHNLHVRSGWDRLYFMDNDRTRRWPCPLPGWVMRRNLVQFTYRVCNMLDRSHGQLFMDAYGQAVGWNARQLATHSRQVLDKAMARSAAFHRRIGLDVE